MKQKRLLALLLALVMVIGLTACGGGDDEASSGGGETSGGESSGSNELTVYTAFPEAEVAYYFNAFEEATGIKVNALRLSAGEMLTRVAAEKDNPQAALMFGGSTDNYIAASNQGLLEAYQSPELSNTPPSPSPATGTGSPTRAMSIPPAGTICWIPSMRTWSSWLTPPPPAPPTPCWPR